MPTGLKQTSSTVAIGFSALETAPNTFTQSSTDLNLSPLDREVFVVTAINLDPIAPDFLAGLNTQVNCALTSTSTTAVANLSSSNCMATATLDIRAAGSVDSLSLIHTDAADEEDSVDLGGRRIIKKKKNNKNTNKNKKTQQKQKTCKNPHITQIALEN